MLAIPSTSSALKAMNPSTFPMGEDSGPLLLQSDRGSNLRSLYKKVDMSHPASKNWLIHLHYVRREFSTCRSIIHEELQRLNGNSEYANYIMALILRSEGKVQESLERLQKCHELEPRNANTVKQIARSLFLLGRHRLSIEAYQKVHLLNGDADWETHYNTGLCYLYLEDLDKVGEHMTLSLQSRVSQEAFQVLAQVAMTRHSLKEAIGVYERALRIFPENSDLLSNLGVLYMRAGRENAAFTKLSSALSFSPANSRAIVGAASQMQIYEDYDYALAKYKIAMQNIPDSASLWNNIGMCYFGKKKFVAAISCLKRASYLCAFDWKILHNLGLVHLYMQQYASAFHFLTAAINLKPDESHSFLLLAVAISHLDDIEHARQAYEQAIRLNKLNPSTDAFKLLLNYAISLSNHKNFSEAHKQLYLAKDYLKQPLEDYDDETRDAYICLKTSLQMMNFQFHDQKPSSEENSLKAEVTVDQEKEMQNLERDLV